MAALVIPTSLFYLVSAVLILSNLCLNEGQTTSLSVELIHHDSSKSPFYNPMESSYDRVTNSVRRSFSRVRRFKSTSVLTKGEECVVTVSYGEYLMNISIGTPGFNIVAVADTGSGLVWTQCKPCFQCFKQEAPIFDPSQSFTYKLISCNASQCHDIPQTLASIGNVAVDTITLASTTGPPVSFPKMVIGCGDENYQGTDGKDSGVIGLGGDEFSLISQMGSSIAGKFSYCLLPITEYSPSFYCLNLEAISVGTKRINYTDVSLGKPDHKGNTIVDSGTTLTLFPSRIYSELESASARQINATRVHVNETFSLCYDAKTKFAVPDITVHFNGADVELQRLNTFLSVSDTVTCFAFTSYGHLSVFGNIGQANFLVGYDNENKTLSFKPTDCTKNLLIYQFIYSNVSVGLFVMLYICTDIYSFNDFLSDQ